MALFKPAIQQFATPIRVQKRIITEENGASLTSYQDAEPALDFCSWKGKGGTQTDAFTITDTAEVTMWYRPDIDESYRVLLIEDESKSYDVLNVENIEQRGMWLKLKVSRSVLDFPHQVTIQIAVIEKDEEANARRVWQNFATVHAAVEPLQGREFAAGAALNIENTVRVRLPYQSGITAKMRLIYSGRIFNINEVIDPNEEHVELHLMCKEVSAGGS